MKKLKLKRKKKKFNQSNIITKVLERDKEYFRAHKGITSTLRPYTPGELKGYPLPTDDIRFIIVTYDNEHEHSRVPLTQEQHDKFIENKMSEEEMIYVFGHAVKDYIR